MERDSRDSATIRTLNAYRKLLKEKQNLLELLKDKTIILYIATLLENTNEDVLNLCFEILEKIVQNEKSHPILIRTFGFFESLESVAIKYRRTNKLALSERASKMLNALRSSSKSNCDNENSPLKKDKKFRNVTAVHQLYFHELTPENRPYLERTLLKIRGIISFITDTEKKYCTVRLNPGLAIKSLARKIEDTCGMKTCLVIKDDDKQEVIMDILSENISSNNSSYTDYFPEEDSPVSKFAIHPISSGQQQNESNNSWLTAAQNFLNESFYW